MKKEDYGRLFAVLESDRKNASSRFDKLLRCDIAEELKEYFVIDGAVNVAVSFDRDGYRIVIRARADRVKTVGILPETLYS